MTEPERFKRSDLPTEGLYAVVLDAESTPSIPPTVQTPKGPIRPGRPLREWRQILANEGGIRDPFGRIHVFDLSPWDNAEPDTMLIVAVTNAPRP